MVRFPKLKECLEEAEVRRFTRMKRKTSRESWAAEIGVTPTSFSEWMRGVRAPEGNNLELLAHDPDIGKRIYDALGKVRPGLDPMLVDVIQHLDDLPKEVQQEIADDVRKKAEANRAKRKGVSGMPGVD